MTAPHDKQPDTSQVHPHTASTVPNTSAQGIPDVLQQLIEAVPPRPEATGEDATGSYLPSDEPASPGLPPELVDHPRYRVLNVLGKGGMGTVYLAEHRLMERTVALKVVDCHLRTSPELVGRFRREVRAIAKLSHPNIVTPFDAEQRGDLLFLAMEYIEGTDLRRLVEESGPLPVTLAANYTLQAALGLQHAHRRGIIHRDIKPRNLVLIHPEDCQQNTGTSGQKAVVKILDFGLARFLQDTGQWIGTPSGFGMGTVGYMAPEQARDAHSAGVHADIYSLGCTLYFLLTGVVPLRGNAQAVIRGEVAITPLRELNPRLPADLIRVIEKMMAKQSGDRYQSCGEIVQALMPWCRAGSNDPPKKPWWKFW